MNTATPTTPTLVAGVSGVMKLVGGSQHICALLAAGTVSCWGDNNSGQLGLGTGVPSTMTPTMVPELTNIVELAGSEGGTCARADTGEVRCWGPNLAGDGEMTGPAVPTLVRW
jgi:alpha-tubulin suppressor-like RCC1 family protein